MGEIVLAAKVTHVPSMFISEQPGPNHGCRAAAIEGLKKIGDLCRERGVDTIIISDTHWLVNAGYHINAKPDMSGVFTSTEFPHFLNNMPFKHAGDPELGQLIAETATKNGVNTLCHHEVETLDLQYGTLVPLRYMGVEDDIKVVSIAGWMYDAELEESKTVGESIVEAVKKSDRKVAFLASGSLSHRIPPNTVVSDYLFKISRPLNQATDLMVLDMWKKGQTKAFLDILPKYAQDCDGEGGMHDTAMLFGLLGWDNYEGCAEMMTEYFPSSGTGQCNVLFPVN
ncbi:3,4-dihydroxyphenylacetate 2,3-dioxygenase [Neptuniibacter caesariensis]|uniref:3,4-dihydroxyphenylacetate 2,3-dioxygenase HpaD_Fe n=1 Tax=Neptuniibacter caesariensis TaxID=207954 RepID=A0A7U8C8X4_NEPCE|nr:3,4-dihydroxyphenylacetate 2,3-dioxygenase [Neptuniibacter caesariensis]EAR61969.1 3,4-dihydroxyphenylacetate 2,3-dioxygenase HpaD_Fe [Oceanospirillum sp. MED92] [Neptuniibacter caesariensis]